MVSAALASRRSALADGTALAAGTALADRSAPDAGDSPENVTMEKYLRIRLNYEDQFELDGLRRDIKVYGERIFSELYMDAMDVASVTTAKMPIPAVKQVMVDGTSTSILSWADFIRLFCGEGCERSVFFNPRASAANHAYAIRAWVIKTIVRVQRGIEPWLVTIDGVEYVDIVDRSECVPTLVKFHEKWDRRLARVGIHMAVCHYSALGDVTIPWTPGLVHLRSRKSIWVPKTMWDAVLAGRDIVRSDIPPVVGLVRGDGSIDLKKLCSLCGHRRVDNVLSSKAVKDFAAGLSESLGGDDVIVRANNSEWIHPRLADFIALRSSTEFAIKATGWIDAARRHMMWVTEERTDMYQALVSEAMVGGQREKKVRDRLLRALTGDGGGGVVEWFAEGIRCDIVTDDTLVEVKHARNLVSVASAIGQVSLYHQWHADKKKRVHVFGTATEIEKCRASEAISTLAHHNGVELTFEIDIR